MNLVLSQSHRLQEKTEARRRAGSSLNKPIEQTFGQPHDRKVPSTGYRRDGKVLSLGEKSSEKIPFAGHDGWLFLVYSFHHREGTNDSLSQQRPKASADQALSLAIAPGSRWDQGSGMTRSVC